MPFIPKKARFATAHRYLATVSESKYFWHYYYPFWLLWRPAVDLVSNEYKCCK